MAKTDSMAVWWRVERRNDERRGSGGVASAAACNEHQAGQ